MSAVMPNSRFIHIPKTGGVWVERSIDYFVQGSEAINVPHPHQGVRQCPGGGKFTFAFVRNPLEWYRSYWAYKVFKGWDEENWFDTKCANSLFPAFIDRMLDRQPGYFEHVCFGLLGANGEGADRIGRQESLADDLVGFLSEAGETFNEVKIRNKEPGNVTPVEIKRKAVYRDGQAERVKLYDTWIWENFYAEGAGN